MSRTDEFNAGAPVEYNYSPSFPGQGQKASQGKMFTSSEKPVAEHRWPRGYTPERMSEVRSAVAGKVRFTGATPFSLTGAATDSPFATPGHGEHGKRLVEETIARSNVPVEHLEGLKGIHINPRIVREGVAGSYDALKRQVDVYPSKGDLGGKGIEAGINVTADTGKKLKRRAALPEYGSTLIHEIGHHADIYGRSMTGLGRPVQENEWLGVISHPKGRGILEGHADRYMLERFRNDPRNQRRTGFNVEQATYGARRNQPEGYPEDLTKRGIAASEQFVNETLAERRGREAGKVRKKAETERMNRYKKASPALNPRGRKTI